MGKRARQQAHNQKRRHFIEREEIVQWMALGMALASREILSRLDPQDFHSSMASIVKRMQESAESGKASEEFDVWMELQSGVRRGKGEKVVDCLMKQLRSDGLIRQAARERKGAATLDGLLLRMERLREQRKS